MNAAPLAAFVAATDGALVGLVVNEMTQVA